jgi:hypothetical protein
VVIEDGIARIVLAVRQQRTMNTVTALMFRRGV